MVLVIISLGKGVGEELAFPTSGAHIGLSYRNFRHVDRLLINVLQIILHNRLTKGDIKHHHYHKA